MSLFNHTYRFFIVFLIGLCLQEAHAMKAIDRKSILLSTCAAQSILWGYCSSGTCLECDPVRGYFGLSALATGIVSLCTIGESIYMKNKPASTNTFVQASRGVLEGALGATTLYLTLAHAMAYIIRNKHLLKKIVSSKKDVHLPPKNHIHIWLFELLFPCICAGKLLYDGIRKISA